MNIRTLVILSVLSILTACKTSPTGRTQVTLFSETEMNNLGNQSFEQIKQQQKISSDKKVQNYVRCVADSIIQALDPAMQNQSWEVVVFEDPSANAFALPGGKIGVHTGLLKVAKNQHQLAAVMGHEVGHVLAEHSNERVSQNQLLGIGMQVAGVALKSYDVKYQQEIMTALGVGSQVGIQLPFSRVHETEADTIGLDLMARAGFNPRESVSLWQNMAKAAKNAPPEFLSTHPAAQSRIENLQNQIPAAAELASKANQQGRIPNCS